MRFEVIAAALAELFQQIARPVGPVVFQAVAEHRVGWMIAECFEQPVADRVEVLLGGILIVVVENEAFRPNRWAFHHHSSPA
jgi:hypothetical protein